MIGKRLVYKLEWTEYERGWGQRSDGYQLCSTLELANGQITEHIEREKKKNPSGVAPDCYSSPGRPQEIEVDIETWKAVRKNGVIWND